MPEFEKPADLPRVWAATGSKRRPTDTKTSQGFVKEQPKFQDVNYMFNKIDAALAHINQFGICKWDNATGYLANKSIVQGSNGVVYIAVADNTNVDPVGDTTYTNWIVWSNPTTLYKSPTTLTPASNFTTSGSIPTLSARVVDGMLILNGGFGMSSAPLSSGELLTTLPVGYRPSAERVLVVGVFPSTGLGGTALARIATDGQITLTLGNWGTTPNVVSLTGSVVM